MKDLPVCNADLASGFLCKSCQKKLDLGEITDFEIDLAKDLLELEEQGKFNYLKNFSFYKAIDYEDVVIIVVGAKDKLKITPQLIRWMKSTYKIEKIIFIEKTKKPRPVVESLIAPFKLMSLNEIFLATGDIEFKAVLRRDDANKMLFTGEELEELISELTGAITRIEFQ